MGETYMQTKYRKRYFYLLLLFTTKGFNSCNRQSEWSSFEFEIVKFTSQGDILVCGDLNARTGTQCDYVENDNDIPEHFLTNLHC